MPARRPARRRAGPESGPSATEFWWSVYLATDDLDATVARSLEAGGSVVGGPFDIPEQGRGALLRDTVGAQFGLWQGSAHVGCEVVNEPGALIRNDLVTPTPEPAREFYAAVFDFTLEDNKDMPGVDFTFLRRPDGHEVGGIFGNPAAHGSTWNTVFEVADTDEAVRRARRRRREVGRAVRHALRPHRLDVRPVRHGVLGDHQGDRLTATAPFTAGGLRRRSRVLTAAVAEVIRPR